MSAYLSTPIIFDNNFVLRRANSQDALRLGKFIAEIHYDALARSVKMMLSGQHPLVQPEDFILIEDTEANNQIVASAAIFNHTWRYANIPFSLAYIECVGTHPDYRQRGLMSRIMNAAHRISEEQGQLVQVISGLRWIYRRFGYEYALEGPGYRQSAMDFIPSLAQDESDLFKIRASQESDIPKLQELYDAQCNAEDKLITKVRNEAIWRYHISGQDSGSLGETYFSILDENEQIIGYFGTWADRPWGAFIVRELSIGKEVPLYRALPSVQRYIRSLVDVYAEDFGESLGPDSIRFDLGFSKTNQHPALKVMDANLSPYRGWTWYVRVDDMVKFLRLISPILEQRLAASNMRGYDGTLTISFYKNGLTLTFLKGKLSQIENLIAPQLGEGYYAAFPQYTFLQLVFGYRSLEELRYAFPDCWANQIGSLLLDAIFPKQDSWAIY